MPCFPTIRWESQCPPLKYWIKQCWDLLVKQDNTACVHVLNQPHVCPEKGSPIKTASWEPILTDAMPWAGPGLGRKITVCQDQGLKPHLAFLLLANEMWSQRTLCVTTTALLFWEKQTIRGRFRANTHSGTAEPLLQAGSREGTGDLVLPQFAVTNWEQLQWNWWNCLNIIWE